VKLATMVACALALASAAAGCGNRAAYWNEPLSATSYRLKNSVAIVDDGASRVVLVEANADQSVSEQFVPIGHNVITAATSTDGNRLFVLSSGDWPPQTPSDQQPSLTVIDVSTSPATVTPPIALPQPMPDLALDPLGNYAVAYTASGSEQTFVENPNEVVLFQLPALGQKVTTAQLPLNIQSFGGTPKQLVFTPPLLLPEVDNPSGTSRQLLLIESTIDLTIEDLGHAFDEGGPRPEITLQLTDGTSTQEENPAGVVVDDGDMTNPNDARIALWTSNDSTVFVFTLTASTGTANPFTPSINSAPVGAIPSAVSFVHTSSDASTDDGLQVLALVPSLSSGVFIDGAGETTTLPLPAAYSSMSLVTSVASSSSTGNGGADIALLWSGSSTTGVAFWDLGASVGGLDVVNVTEPVQSVLSVGGADSVNPQLRVLQLSDGGLYVLDLSMRTAAPLDTNGTASLTISDDGKRLWAYAQNGTNLAEITLPDLAVVPLTTPQPIGSVYDIDVASSPASSPSHALVATDPASTWGATVFDADDPTTANARTATALLLEPSP
jgi:hypothetical protein